MPYILVVAVENIDFSSQCNFTINFKQCIHHAGRRPPFYIVNCTEGPYLIQKSENDTFNCKMPLIVLIHNQKSGGTALREAMQNVTCGKHCVVNRYYGQDKKRAAINNINDWSNWHYRPPSCHVQLLLTDIGIGWCDIVRRPCLYITSFRNPYERWLSDYNYFCRHGMESKKMWTEASVKSGTCNVSFFEWVSGRIGHKLTRKFDFQPNIYMSRLTHTPTSVPNKCTTFAAKQNLNNNCMYFSDVANQSSIFKFMFKFKTELQFTNNSLDALLQTASHFIPKNVATFKKYDVSDEEKYKVLAVIGQDMQLYSWAMKQVDKQTLQFC